MTSPAWQRAQQALHKAHAADPQGQEVAYCASVVRFLGRLRPDASPALRLAAEAQHLERWVISRDSYPMDREGYLRWRKAVAKRQGERLRELCADSGLEPAMVERAAQLVAKALPLREPDQQALEDCACLVFLEEQIADFAPRHAEKMIPIIRKTWNKMSEPARALALGIPMNDDVSALVQRALSGDTPPAN